MSSILFYVVAATRKKQIFGISSFFFLIVTNTFGSCLLTDYRIVLCSIHTSILFLLEVTGIEHRQEVVLH